MLPRQPTEVISVITFDGHVLLPDIETVRILAYGNLGAPPVNFLTRKGYKQHGATEVEWLLEPRTVTMTIWRAPQATRADYWSARLELHDFFRHNRNGPLTIILRRADGSNRALIGRANPGLVFPPGPTDQNHWDINESIEFLCLDPTLFDPDITVYTVSAAVGTDLIFPIVFPIKFGPEGVVFIQTLTYSGTWRSWPVLTLTGPYSSALLQNVTTGISLTLAVPLAAGAQRIINLKPGSQSITDASGNSQFGDLAPDSNLVDWDIRPDPEVAGGVQTLRAQLIGGIPGSSTFRISYNTRYLGI